MAAFPTCQSQAELCVCTSHLTISLHEEGTVIPILQVRTVGMAAGKEAGRKPKVTCGAGIREKPE